MPPATSVKAEKLLPTLDRAQFAYFAAKTGFDATWKLLETLAKARDFRLFHDLRERERGDQFTFDDTVVYLVNKGFKVNAPRGVMVRLDHARLRDAWLVVASFEKWPDLPDQPNRLLP